MNELKLKVISALMLFMVVVAVFMAWLMPITLVIGAIVFLLSVFGMVDLAVWNVLVTWSSLMFGELLCLMIAFLVISLNKDKVVNTENGGIIYEL